MMNKKRNEPSGLGKGDSPPKTGTAPFSRRTDWLLDPNGISTVLEDLKRRKIPVIDLTESNPTRCGFCYPLEGILKSFQNPLNLEYRPESQGIRPAREAVAALYDGVDAGSVFLTASTSEAYSFLFRLLADVDDEILFPSPSYPLFQYLADLNDLRLQFFSLKYDDDNGWGLDFDSVSRLISKRTKALVTVNPNNPTGSFIREEELGFLNDLCREKNLALVSDEVFFDYHDGPGRPLTLAGNAENLTFVLGGLSKSLALPQMKLSWIIVSGPDRLKRAAIEKLDVIADTYLSVNTPVQNALPALLSFRRQVQDDIRARVRHNSAVLEKSFCGAEGIKLLRREGGWYSILKIPGSFSEEETVVRLLEEQHVYVHPGYYFDFPDEPYLVLSLIPSEKDFEKGVRRLTQFLK